MVCSCPECTNIVINLTEFQLKLINRIRKEEKIKIDVTETRYYGMEYSDWESVVLKNQYVSWSKKFADEIFNIEDIGHKNGHSSKNHFLFDVRGMGILKQKCTHSPFKNIQHNIVDPQNGKLSHSYDVDIENVVEFSDEFKAFEDTYGTVHFMTHYEFENSKACPSCGYVGDFENVVRDDKEFIQELSKFEVKNGKTHPLGIYPVLKSIVDKLFSDSQVKALYDESKKEIEEKSVITYGCEKKPEFTMLAYLEGIINCEKSKRILLNQLHEYLGIYYRNKTIYERKKVMFLREQLLELECKIEMINKDIRQLSKPIILQETDYVNNNIKCPTMPIKPINRLVKPQRPELKVANFFNKKTVALENQNLLKVYELDMQEYEKSIVKYDADMRVYDEAIKIYENEYIKFQKQCEELKEKLMCEQQSKMTHLQKEKEYLENEKENFDFKVGGLHDELTEKIVSDYMWKEIQEIKAEIIKVNTAMNQLYALNVIYPKYLDFVAITTFYEYFLTGRCDSLEGPTGAYNLYESELRSNIIINKLDSIIEQLDQIKDNQYQMFCVMNEISDTQKRMKMSLNEMVGEIRTISKTSKKIETLASITAYNTAKTAYYSRLNNGVLKSIGLLVALQ